MRISKKVIIPREPSQGGRLSRSSENEVIRGVDLDATHERTPIENEKLRRDQELRERNSKPKSPFPERNAAGLNEKDGEDEIEDLYREEENRGTVEAT